MVALFVQNKIQKKNECKICSESRDMDENYIVK